MLRHHGRSYDSLVLVQRSTNGTGTGKSDNGDICTRRTCTPTNGLRTTRNVHFKGFAPHRTSHGATDRVYFWYSRLSLLDTYTYTSRPTWDSGRRKREHIVGCVDWHGGVEFEADGCSGEVGCV